MAGKHNRRATTVHQYNITKLYKENKVNCQESHVQARGWLDEDSDGLQGWADEDCRDWCKTAHMAGGSDHGWGS